MSEQRAGMFASLKVRDFALLWSGQGVSGIGDGIFSVALVLETLHVDDHPIALAYVIAARAVPSIIFSLLGGVMVDRLPRRFIMLVADLVRGLASSPFSLLATPIGEDCAGAVRFAPADQDERILGRSGDVTWLSEDGVAERIRDLREDSTAWLGRPFTGQFSLAGAQAKTALLFVDGRVGGPVRIHPNHPHP